MILHVEEYEVLNRARAILGKAENLHSSASIESREFGHGRAAEAAQIAENAIFNYISTASSYMNDETAKPYAVHVGASQ